jgi:hypothetical protein
LNDDDVGEATERAADLAPESESVVLCSGLCFCNDWAEDDNTRSHSNLNEVELRLLQVSLIKVDHVLSDSTDS